MNTNVYPSGSRKKLIRYMNFVAIFSMFHSSFVAPAQDLFLNYVANVTMKDYTPVLPKEELPAQDVLKDQGSLWNSENPGMPYLEHEEKASEKDVKEYGKRFEVYADINRGTIGRTEKQPLDSPSDNVFRFSLEALPQGYRAFLKYELYGVENFLGVSRSINERTASGGYLVRQSGSWNEQVEELNPSWLRVGDNTIMFTTPGHLNHNYMVKGVHLVFEKDETFGGALVLQTPVCTLLENNRVYLRGFLRSHEPSGEVWVTVGKERLEVREGVFEGLVSLSEKECEDGRVAVAAYDTKGLLGQEIVMLSGEGIVDKIITPVAPYEAVFQKFSSAAPGYMETEGVVLRVQEEAVPEEVTLSVRKLRKVDMAPLSSGMINVTKGGGGYRFLPDGMRFKAGVALEMEYDSLKIPPGYTPNDIRTFYFDTKAKRWISVPKDSVDRKHKKIISRTTHFTDYINGIIQMPESPESSAFLPTMMSEVQAANPASDITVISPPSPSQTGEASLNYPFHIPAGRNGMQPHVGLQYNSDGGSNWTGYGWSMPVSAITLDTRWGTPLFDPNKETELYQLNGQQLMYPDNYLPHRHEEVAPEIYTTEMQNRTAFLDNNVKKFTPRKQGGFAKIERLGTQPSNYYWKVTGTNGLISWYGGDATGINENAVVRDSNNNIVHWGICLTEDLFKNNIKYTYLNTTITSSTNLNGGKVFYIKHIHYTGYEGNQGNYRLDFIPDTDIRSDARINGRNKIKQVDPYLLDRVEIWHNTEKIRIYKLEYEEGEFYKTVLKSITEASGDEEHEFRHVFDYYGKSNMFSEPINIPLPSISPSYTMNMGNILNSSKIYSNETTEAGYEVRLGTGIEIKMVRESSDPERTFMFHMPLGENVIRSKGRVTFADIDGDGVDDIIYRTSNGLSYIPGTVGGDPIQLTEGEFPELLTNQFTTTPKSIHNISDFSRSRGYTRMKFGESLDVNVKLKLLNLSFYAGKRRMVSKNTSSIYLTDGNNDGLLDVVRDGVVYFNKINPSTGEPVFVTSSALTENMLITAEPGIEWSENSEEYEDIASPVEYDAVRFWQAPRDGKVKIYSDATLLDTNKAARLSIEMMGQDVSSPNCPLPSNLAVLMVSSTQAVLSWEGSSEHISYEWEVRTPQGQVVTSGVVQTGETTLAFATGLTPGTQYHFYVRGICETVTGSFAGPLVFTTDTSGGSCPQPTNLTVTYVSDTLAVVTWNGSPSHTHYTWQVTQGGTPVISGNTTSTTAIIEGLSPTTQYAFQVTGHCGTSQSTPAGPVNFTTTGSTGGGTCAPPTNLALVYVLSNSAVLSWSPSPDAVNGYIWTVYNAATSDYVTGGQVNAGQPTEVTVTGLSPMTQYNFYVVSLCSGSQSSPAGPFSFTTSNTGGGSGDCYPPINPVVSDLGCTQATISWTASPNVTVGYVWQVYSNGNFISGGSVGPQFNQVTVTGLSQGVSYQFYVSAVCNGLQSILSSSLPFTTLTNCGGGNCNPPSNVVVDNVGCTSAQISWTAPSGDVQGYSWVAYQGSTLVNSGYVPAGQTQAVVYGLSVNTSYTVYLITICDGNENSSAGQSFSTLANCGSVDCEPVTNLTLQNTTCYAATVSWTPSATADFGYAWFVYPAGSNPSSTPPAASGLSVTASATIAGLNPGTSYDFYIITLCDGDESELTGTLNFTTTGDCDPPNDCQGPSNIIAQNITCSSVIFSVTASSEAIYGYAWYIYEQGANPNMSAPVASGTVTPSGSPFTIEVSGLEEDTEYDFYVISLCDDTQSTLGTPFDFTTSVCSGGSSCAPPTNLTVFNITCTSASFLWTHSSDQTNGYTWEAYVSGTTPGTDVPVATGYASGTGGTVTGLIPGLTYNVYVYTLCDDLQSASAGPLVFTTNTNCGGVCKQPLFTWVQQVTCETSTFFWWPSQSAVNGYLWEIYETNPPGSAPVASGYAPPGTSNATASNLSPETDYKVLVKSVCQSSVSVNASFAYFTTDTCEGMVVDCEIQDCKCYQVVFEPDNTSGIQIMINGTMLPNWYFFGGSNENISLFVADFIQAFGILPDIAFTPGGAVVLNVASAGEIFSQVEVTNGQNTTEYTFWGIHCDPVSECYEVTFDYHDRIVITINGVEFPGYTDNYYNLDTTADYNAFIAHFIEIFGVVPTVTLVTSGSQVTQVIITVESDTVQFLNLSTVGTVPTEPPFILYSFVECTESLLSGSSEMEIMNSEGADNCLFGEGDNCLLFGVDLDGNNTTSQQVISTYGTDCGSGDITVKKGDRIYFRYHNAGEESGVVDWDHKVEYVHTATAQQTDASGVLIYDSSYKDSFVLSGNGIVEFPSTSTTAAVTWDSFTVSDPSDVIIYEIFKIDDEAMVPVYTKVCMPGQVTTVAPVGVNNINVTTAAGTDETYSSVSLFFSVKSRSNTDWPAHEWKPTVQSSFDFQGNAEDYIKQVIPEYTIYKPYLCSGLYNRVSMGLFNTGTELTIAPLLNNIFNQQDAGKSVNFVVRKGNQLVGSRRITVLSTNSGIQLFFDDTTPIDIPFSTNDQLEIGFYAASYRDSDLIAKIHNYQGAVVKIQNGISDFYLNSYLINLFVSAKDPLSLTYRNWGQFFYNPHMDENPSTPTHTVFGKLINNEEVNSYVFVNNQMEDILEELEAQCSGLPENQMQECMENTLSNIIDLPGTGVDETNFDSVLAALQDYFDLSYLTGVVLPARPSGSIQNQVAVRQWEGVHSSQYSQKHHIKAGGIWDSGFGTVFVDTDEDAAVLQADLETGMFAPASGIVHRSTSHAYTLGGSIPVSFDGVPAAGVLDGGLNVSYSESGYSHTLTSFIDLNGDGYPDMLYADNLQTTTMTGGHRSASGNHGFGPVSKGDSKNVGITISGGHTRSGSPRVLKSSKGERFGVAKPHARIGLGLNAALNGENKEKEYWMDVNGDGLPDRITEGTNGYVYQLGQVDGAVSEAYHNLSGSTTTPRPLGVNFGMNLNVSSILENIDIEFALSLALGFSASGGNTEAVFMDVNGDGLADLFVTQSGQGYVYYNTGHRFSSQPEPVTAVQNHEFIQLEEDARNRSASVSGSLGVYFGFPVGIPIPFGFIPLIHIKAVGLVVGGNANLTVTDVRKSFRDMNGDGFVDYVQYIESNNTVRVQYSLLGKANRLKSFKTPVTRRNGGFELSYSQQPNTYQNPKPQWVLSEMRVLVGYEPDGTENESMGRKYVYENGRYDRREREFLGYGTVMAEDYQLEENLTFEETPYRTVVSHYHNESYYLAGLLKEQYLAKGAATGNYAQDQVFSRSTHEYTLYGLQNGNMEVDLSNPLPVTYDVGGTEGRSTAMPLLVKTNRYNYELGSTPMVFEETFEYDSFGRLSLYTHLGDVNTTADNFTTEVTYHSSTTLTDNHLRNIPEEMKVFIGTTLKRSRSTADIDEAKGTVGKIISAVDSQNTSDVTLEYDIYGNLSKVILPENVNNEAMFYEYTYDTQEHKYIVEIEDAFGYVAQSLFDYRFDKILKQVDITGNEVNYTYDSFGRSKTIQGPKELALSIPYTLSYEYLYDYDVNGGYANCISSVTSHYDPQHFGNDIETFIQIDDLGRVRKVMKDITMDDQEYLSVGGIVRFDAFGRMIRSYQPSYIEKYVFVCEGAEAYDYSNPYFSETVYDEMDRPVLSMDPEGNESAVVYAIDNGLAKTTVSVEQNTQDEIISHIYKDILGRTVRTENVGPSGVIETLFSFNAIHELLSYTDADGLITSYGYDLLGRKTDVTHPDRGTTSFEYDLAGNLLRIQTANLQPLSEYIQYQYEFNRLIGIEYPQLPGGPNLADVEYQYGASGNETGRLIYQRDATGEQHFEYGIIGEMTHVRRMITGPNIPTRTFDTYFNYDSWNRLVSLEYPDEERVIYSYDYGGNLKSVYSSDFDYYYVQDIAYDWFEQPVLMEYGNGTVTDYTYTPEMRRMQNLKVQNANTFTLLDNSYQYDKVGNVTEIANTAGTHNPNGMLGDYQHSFTYDVLNRLSAASGQFDGDSVSQLPQQGNDFGASYSLSMAYNNTHGIVNKVQDHIKNNNAFQLNTYDNTYQYYNGTHRVSYIEDSLTGYWQNFVYDANGNLSEKTDSDGNLNEYYWDEENRLRVLSDEVSDTMQHYIYDAGGQRVLKASSYMTEVYENGQPVAPEEVQFETYTTYPSSLIVVKGNGEYSKHYFKGSQRIAARVGEGLIDEYVLSSFGSEGLTAENTAMDSLRQQQIQDLEQRLGQSVTFAAYNPQPAGAEEEAVFYDEDRGLEEEEFMAASTEEWVYFYHPDHLGTATLLTDVNGEPYQFFLNLPFGETMAEQHSLTGEYDNRWKFTGHELDKETGLYYAGARYYDPRTSIWLSVDPLAEVFPNWNPYNYVMQNPLKLTDPTGMSPEGGGGGDGSKTSEKVDIELDEVVVSAKRKNRSWTTESSRYSYGGTPQQWEEQYGMKTSDYTSEMNNEYIAYTRQLDLEEQNRILLEKFQVFLYYFVIAEDVVYVHVAGVVTRQALKVFQKLAGGKRVVVVNNGATKGVTRSLDDLSTLRGATWKEAESLIPKGWTRGPLNKGEGIKFVNPAKKGEQILLEKGWPGAKDPLHSGPYMKVSRDGTVTRIPLQGNPTLK